MKLGTQVKLPDGRMGTVVFNGLVGVGIKWGLHDPPPEDFENTHGDLFDIEPPANFKWNPDALLREPFKTCKENGYNPEDCVGKDFEVIRAGYGC